MNRYYYFLTIVKNSLITLNENKRRTFLTTLGIIIGVSSVIVIMAIGMSAQGLVLSQVKKTGSNLVGILPGKSESNGPPATAFGISITTLVYDDALALMKKSNVPHATAVAAYTRGIGTVSAGSRQTDADLMGVSGQYIAVEGGEVASGRFFTEDEDKSVARVAVLGSAAKTELFDGDEAVGKKIKVKNQTFEVIGVMTERGQVAFQNYDNYVFLPLNAMQKLITGTRHLGFMRAKVDYEANVAETMDDIKYTLRAQHDIKDQTGENDDFSVRAASDALTILTTITDSLRFFLGAMAALSLLVGGIGIMNIMLIRVAQRTREIGLRKAVGATNADIRLQFLVESVMMTALGGIIGIIFGELISWLVAVVAQYMGYDWAFIVTPSSIILAVAVSMAIGLIFGLYPAKKASKLNPIEALRYE